MSDGRCVAVCVDCDHLVMPFYEVAEMVEWARAHAYANGHRVNPLAGWPDQETAVREASR